MRSGKHDHCSGLIDSAVEKLVYSISKISVVKKLEQMNQVSFNTKVHILGVYFSSVKFV